MIRSLLFLALLALAQARCKCTGDEDQFTVCSAPVSTASIINACKSSSHLTIRSLGQRNPCSLNWDLILS